MMQMCSWLQLCTEQAGTKRPTWIMQRIALLDVHSEALHTIWCWFTGLHGVPAKAAHQ